MKCKVVCTTHFLEIFSLGLLQDGDDGITALRMAVQLPRTQNEDALPLFRLEAGVASSSAGLVCAKAAGMDKSVIIRAAEVLDALKNGRQVEPLPDLCCAPTEFSQAGLHVLRCFFQVDSWANVSDDDLRSFLRKVAQTSFLEPQS
jgi:DNA mismatch repair protein MSH5